VAKGVLLMTTSNGRNLVSLRTRLIIGAVALAGAGIAGAAIMTSGDGDREATIPAGTVVVASLEHTVTTKHAAAGDVVLSAPNRSCWRR
jgi:hypothetical protein